MRRLCAAWRQCGVTSGQGVLVGALFGVASVDGVQNAVIECPTKGVFEHEKSLNWMFLTRLGQIETCDLGAEEV